MFEKNIESSSFAPNKKKKYSLINFSLMFNIVGNLNISTQIHFLKYCCIGMKLLIGFEVK